MSENQVEDPTDQQHQVLVQEHTARLDERIKQQFDKLIKENQLRVPKVPSINWSAVIFGAILVATLAMGTYMVIRQQTMDQLLRKEVERNTNCITQLNVNNIDISKLKTQLGEAIKNIRSLEDEIELLKNIKSRIKDLEKKIEN